MCSMWGLKLKKPVKLTRQRLDFVMNEFGLDAHRASLCRTGHEAQLVGANSCSKRDVVLIRSVDGINYIAGRVWVHFDIEGQLWSLVETWTVSSYDSSAGEVQWDTQNGLPTYIATRDIIVAVVNRQLTPNVIRTLVPWSVRNLKPIDD